LSAAPLCPEIGLYLASEVTPLWEATEASLKRNGLPPPFWAFAWPGGQALARWILDHPEAVAGQRVLDFGAGCGLGAIAAAKAGAAAVTATEIDAFAAAAIGLNAAQNGVGLSVVVDDVVGQAPAWDIVLCGDVCYERPMAEALIRWIRRLAAEGVRVLLADPGRAYLPESGLVRLASYRVPTSLDLEDSEHRDTVVYALGAS
jgi:predicted nicotinamide N-methyase